MKNILLACLFFFSFIIKSEAQFVTIPDANFVSFLQINYPGAMVGNMMDTTDVSIVNETNLAPGLNSLNIQDLTGMQYFDNLDTLDCSNNAISILPNLPSSLKYLACGSNQLTSLPPLPSSLKSLTCINNLLNSLPALPSSMDYLDCYGNQLTSLPILPSSMTYLNCLGNQLTFLPALPNAITYLNCKSNQLTSFPSLPFSLIELNCSFNLLNALPALPSSLTILECAGNQLASLPSLPNSLYFLVCASNQLASLPSLPNSLGYLDGMVNQLTSLPTLPNSILVLYCNNNLLTSLPSLPLSLNTLDCTENQLIILPTLPPSLQILGCDVNQLTSLPALPASLIYLSCSSNLLSSLPALPNTLTKLLCGNNQLTSLPILENTSLQEISSSTNNLISISRLPSTLYILECANNQLTSIPLLPDSLGILQCSNNTNLSCLPKLNPSLGSLSIINTSITCLPNIPNTFISGVVGLPICGPSDACPFYWTISGNIHQDNSISCASDSLQPGNRLKNIKVQLLKNNISQEQMYITNIGEYSFDTGNNDTLDVQVDTVGFPFLVSCPATFFHNVILTPVDSFKENINFGIKCNGVDARVESIMGTFRPATIREVTMKAGDASQFYNMNCGPFSGTLTTTLIGQVSYVSPSLGALTPSSIVGNTLTYTIPDFSVIDPSVAFNFLAMADTTATVGSQVCVTTKITNVINDTHPNNDSLEMCFDIVNSFDPNDKQVSPKNAEAGDWLHYTIRFQNTGNDTAFLVVIQDTLSANLDIPSFTYLASSHNAITQVKNNIVTFTFPKINLLDSLNHEPESHGWIQFKIKLKSGLPNGTITNNKASIYFDFNPPIVTNVTTNTIGPLSITNTLATHSFIHIYPNPASNYFTIEHSFQGQVTAQLYSIEGRLIQSKTLTKNKEVFGLKNIISGMYLLEVSNDKGERRLEKIVLK